MKSIAVIGAQWGDEGKGKYIDILSEKADVVVRAQGGNNAGHTVVSGGKTYKMHLVPSGILYPNTLNIIAAGVVADPEALLKEMAELKSLGVKFDGLRIDERTHVIMPYHRLMDEILEEERGADKIGTTKRGIGPCYMDKAERVGIRFYDLIRKDVFAEKTKVVVAHKNKMLAAYGREPLNADEIIETYSAYAKELKGFVCDTGVLVYDAVKANKYVLFEGAQGTMLDLDNGTYPFVTSSHPTTGGFCTGCGIGPSLIKECLGIAKSYTTRVGAGPFPTELFDANGEHLLNVGQEYGVTTGRARRCGWQDCVVLRHSVRVNGLTAFALNKLDPLTGLDELKICTAYKINGKTVKDFPADIRELENCEPVYITMDGWKEDITHAKKVGDLPKAALNYIKEIEKQIGCKIAYVGIGPGREQYIEL